MAEKDSIRSSSELSKASKKRTIILNAHYDDIANAGGHGAALYDITTHSTPRKFLYFDALTEKLIGTVGFQGWGRVWKRGFEVKIHDHTFEVRKRFLDTYEWSTSAFLRSTECSEH